MPLDTETFDVSAQIVGGGNQALVYRAVFGSDPAVWDQAVGKAGDPIVTPPLMTFFRECVA